MLEGHHPAPQTLRPSCTNTVLPELLDNELGALALVALDWGAWTETCRYLQGKNPTLSRHEPLPRGRNALEQAVKWGMIARNPADLVQLPRKQAREMSACSPEEAQRFLAAAREDPWFAVFSLLLDAGLRPGEALALKWSDMDLAGRRLTVRRTLTRNAQGWSFAEPKTALSRRNVPFTSPLQRVLVAHRDTQNTNPHNLVFVGEGGKPLHANNLGRRNLPRILERAGLAGDFRLYDLRHTLYDLRHTCATLMLLAGVHSKVVSERLGHASVKITLDTYSHVLPTMQREATERLGTLLYPELPGERAYN